MSFLFVSFLVSVALVVRHLRKVGRNSTLPLPPGPRKLPWIGNLLDMPKRYDHEWETYEKWGKLYKSDIIHLDVAGSSIVVLNKLDAASELLERRSSIYSNRPRFVMMNELMGWGFNFAFMQYNEEWRARRRLFQQEFNAVAAQRFHPRQLTVSHDLLRRLLDDPENFMVHIRHMAGSNILSTAYGIEVLPSSDPYVAVAEDALDSIAKVAVPGAFLVESIPLLKYIPEWFPGADFKRKARKWQKLSEAFYEMPFDAAKRKIASGAAAPSFLSSCFDNMDDLEDSAPQERVIQSTAATMHAGAVDSTFSVMCTFFLAMLANPEAQKRAHKELDATLRPGDLPQFCDQDSLPFISAIVKEVLRWKTIAPIGIPHALVTEDVYRGYRIPAGTVVISNIWAMLHDETVYPDPHSFNPERFMKDGKLDPDVQDPNIALFGFGRRICPGRFMAYSSVWMAIASILSVFEITKAIDEDGEVVEPSYEYACTLAYIPLPFKCRITPRGKDAECLIRSTAYDR